MTEFREMSLFGFISCSPKNFVPEVLYDHFFAPTVPSKNGEALFAQYSLRKVEAALERDGHSTAVAHPSHIGRFIEKAEVVGLTAMDPLGIGPVTSTFRLMSKDTTYNHHKFRMLLDKIKGRTKVVVGGAGAWQFLNDETREEYGIDHVLVGEFERDGSAAMEAIADGSAPPVITLKSPAVSQIPEIVKPSINGLVEVMRGCGRMCKFCDPTMHKKRDIPIESIKDEVALNRKFGKKSAWLHSEDVFLYGMDSSDFQPNHDAVMELFREVMSTSGGCGVTHISLAAIAADPELVKEVSDVCMAGPRRWMGVQPGIETGSPTLMEKTMKNKAKPFQADEWPDVVRNAIKILNDNCWFPACTVMVGSPQETDDDVQETIDLVRSLNGRLCVLAPLLYTNIGNGAKIARLVDMTPKQRELIKECWKHSFRTFMKRSNMGCQSMNPILRLAGNVLIKAGSAAIIAGLGRLK